MGGVLYFKNGDSISYNAADVLKEEDLTSEISDEVWRTAFNNTPTFSCATLIDAVDMYKLDVLLRPYVICCNPEDELLFEEYKKKGFIIYTDAFIEEGMCYVIDRSKLELEGDVWYTM